MTIQIAMNNKPQYIAYLIRRFLTDEISAEERKELNMWLEEDLENAAMLRRFTDDKQIRKDADVWKSIDVDQSWKAFQERRGVSKKIKFRRNWQVAAAVFILFSLGLSLLWLRSDKTLTGNQKDSPALVKDDISPANGGANLIRPDGSIVTIESEEVHMKGTNIYLSQKEKEEGVDFLPMGEPSSQMNTLEVPKAKFLRVVLSDGTKVWVNSMSKLHFPNQFALNERKVTLEGEAYFEVQHEASRPFIVESGASKVKVLGTEFNVNNYGEHVETTLKEGKVEVSNKRDKVILIPGEQSKSDENGIKTAKVDIQQILSWKNNEFLFRDENVVSIASQLSRWYGVQIKFRGNINYKKLYTGSINRDVHLSEVIHMLEFVSDLTFGLENNEMIIQKEN